MGRGVTVPSPRSGIQPLAVTFLFLACLASHACGSCLSYGHSCWGAHGKRSGDVIPRSYPNEGLLDSDLPSRVQQHPRTSPSSSTANDPQDALWLLSKLMAATQSEPDDSGGDDEDTSMDTKNIKIWRKLLDVNNGGHSHGISQLSKTKRRLGSIAVPAGTDIGTGVGIVEIGSTPSAENGDVRRGLILLAEDPEEEEDGREEEDSPTDTTSQDVSRGDTGGRSKDSRFNRKAFRRLRILNLLDNLEKKRI